MLRRQRPNPQASGALRHSAALVRAAFIGLLASWHTRDQADTETHRRLAPLLTDELMASLDALLVPDAEVAYRRVLAVVTYLNS